MSNSPFRALVTRLGCRVRKDVGCALPSISELREAFQTLLGPSIHFTLDPELGRRHMGKRGRVREVNQKFLLVHGLSQGTCSSEEVRIYAQLQGM